MNKIEELLSILEVQAIESNDPDLRDSVNEARDELSELTGRTGQKMIGERIVCAAIKWGDLIIPSVRHHDRLMNVIIRNLKDPDYVFPTDTKLQGFVDNRHKFYNRADAYELVQQNGQHFNPNRNSHSRHLFSEGLY